MSDILQLAKAKKVNKSKFPTGFFTARIRRIYPMNDKDGNPIVVTFKNGEKSTKHNVVFTITSDPEYKDVELSMDVLTVAIKYNGITSVAGCDAYVTISKRVTTRDSKNYKAGDEVPNLDSVEFSYENMEAMLSKGNAITMRERKN